MKRILVTSGASILFGATALIGTASAVPAGESVVGGPGSHIHHVHTGSGCQEVGVPMEPGSRGLHRAGSEPDGVEDHGPFHGPCH